MAMVRQRSKRGTTKTRDKIGHPGAGGGTNAWEGGAYGYRNIASPRTPAPKRSHHHSNCVPKWQWYASARNGAPQKPATKSGTQGLEGGPTHGRAVPMGTVILHPRAPQLLNAVTITLIVSRNGNGTPALETGHHKNPRQNRAPGGWRGYPRMGWCPWVAYYCIPVYPSA